MRLPIPDDWSGEFCRYAVCWPNSPKWKAILRGLVSQAARGWSWDEKTGDLIFTLGAMRSVLPQNLELREVIMACGDEGLDKVADALFAIARNQCCDGGAPDNGGIHGYVEDGEGESWPIYGQAPPMALPTGKVPEDYDGTYEQYLLDKCALSAQIVRGVINTARNWAYINFAQTAGLITTIVILIAGGVIVPVFLIPALIAAAIGLVGIQAALLALANGMQDNFDDLVCALYSNDTVRGMIEGVSTILGAILTLIPATGRTASFLRLVAGILFSTDTLNQLLTLDGSYAEPYDCSGCDDPSLGPWNVERGDAVDWLAEQWIEATADNPSCDATRNRVNVQFDSDGVEVRGCDNAVGLGGVVTLVGVEVVSGSITQTGVPKLRIRDANGDIVVSTNTLPWFGSVEATRVALAGTSATEYRIKLSFSGTFGDPVHDPLP